MGARGTLYQTQVYVNRYGESFQGATIQMEEGRRWEMGVKKNNQNSCRVGVMYPAERRQEKVFES